MKTYYYLYQITNLVNAKIYVGVHKTRNLNDGYMGSGKVIRSAIEKYGIENFQKDILEFFEDPKAMYAREKEVVTDEFLLREDTYNLRRGGYGGFDYINKDKTLIQKRNSKVAQRRDNTNQLAARKLVMATSEYRSKVSKLKKKYYENHPGTFTGKQHSANTKQLMSTIAKARLADPTKNSQFGTMWITDGTNNKKIKKDANIPKGWNKGRTIRP